MSNIDVLAAKESPQSSHAPYKTIAVPICKREKSSMVARISKKPHVDIATENATEVVKDEDFLNVTKAAESQQQLPEAVIFQKRFLQSIKMVFCSKDEVIRDLHETHVL